MMKNNSMVITMSTNEPNKDNVTFSESRTKKHTKFFEGKWFANKASYKHFRNVNPTAFYVGLNNA